MTQDTRAERLRVLIATEDEDVYQEQLRNHTPLELAPMTAKAIKVFLERLHLHEINTHEKHRCYFCALADDMIKEFQ